MSDSPTAPVVDSLIVETLSLNDIAALQPRALEVFDRYGLDSCCGGAKTLAHVCEKHQLDLDAVLRALRALS